MICKVFEYEDLLHGTSLYLNGPDSANPDKLLFLYIDWFNTDFRISEKIDDEKRSCDFKFVRSFCPIDFYDDYKKSPECK